MRLLLTPLLANPRAMGNTCTRKPHGGGRWPADRASRRCAPPRSGSSSPTATNRGPPTCPTSTCFNERPLASVPPSSWGGKGTQHQLLWMPPQGPAKAPALGWQSMALAGARRGAASGWGRKKPDHRWAPGQAQGSAAIAAIRGGAPGADHQNCQRQGPWGGKRRSRGDRKGNQRASRRLVGSIFSMGRGKFGVRPATFCPMG